MRKYFLLAAIFLLTACAPRENLLPVSATATPHPSQPYEGKWQGTGGAADGKVITLAFTVQGSSVTSIQYQFEMPGGTVCFNMTHMVIPEAERLQIEDRAFTASFDPDLNLSAVFDSESSASGHLSGSLNNYRWPYCNSTFEVDWTATKTTAVSVPPAPEKRRAPNALETLLQILIFGLSNGAVLALNAIGVTLIYGTVRTLNLAHGDVFALTTVLVTSAVNAIGIQRGWSPLRLASSLLIVFSAACAFGALLSVAVERFAFQPFRGHSRLAPLIATLGLSFILFQGALVWRTFQASWIPGEHRSVPGLPEVPTDGIPSLLPEINLTEALGLPARIVIRFSDVFVLVAAILLVRLATWLMQRTRTGRAIRAISQNPQMAQMLGIPVNQTIRRAFAIGGGFAGAAAFIFALYYARPFGLHGAQSGLLAFAAALLGGIGSPLGALISGLLIGVFSSLSDYYLQAQWTSVLLLSLLIILLAWKPTGLASSDGGWQMESVTVRDSVILTAPSPSRSPKRWLILLAAFGAIPILSQIFGMGSQVILRSAGIFIIVTLGLNLVLGMAGILDLGFAISYGVGAYAAALLGGLNIFLVLLVAVALAALTGLIKGLLARRLRGDFLAVATLAFGLLGRQLIVNLNALTGGAGGIGSIPSPHFLDFKLVAPIEKFFLVFALVLFAAWISSRLMGSRIGRSWIASSEDELATISAGVDVRRARTLAFVLSSALAGLAGALYASTFSFVDPELMAFHISAMVLTMVVLGGAGSVSGAIGCALVIVLYDKVIVPRLADWLALIWPIAIGSVPDIRGASYFNFGIALYLTVLLRARRK